MSSATSRVPSIAISSASSGNPYETDKLLNEYLLFHYGGREEVLPFPQGPVEALHYPVRCVHQCLDLAALPSNARALDLGCAVGRSTFELAKHCTQVVGIDYSQRFVAAAETVRATGSLPYMRLDEGRLLTPLMAVRPAEVEAARVQFEQGDAMALRADLGVFDVVLMANLIDRLSHPARCLQQLSGLIRSGGQLVVTSPYTWMDDYTSPEHWLGGFEEAGERRTTLQGLHLYLDPNFELKRTLDLPFLIREHARKYQWSVAQASVWRRR